jgi:hypothetical protein
VEIGAGHGVGSPGAGSVQGGGAIPEIYGKYRGEMFRYSGMRLLLHQRSASPSGT